MDKKQAGRLSNLRKFISTPEDVAIVKEMIADGLSDEDIMHALGHVDSMPSGSVLPNGHEYSNQQTTEQQEQEEQAAGLGQPGEDVGGDGSGEDGGNDMLTHVAGLLTHVANGKANNGPKGSGAGGKGR